MHQYLMKVLINPNFEHQSFTSTGSVKVFSAPSGKVHRIHSVLSDSLVRLHNAISNMKNVYDICIYE